jgi:hypothetical protein
MAVTYAEFIVRYKEFELVEQTVIDAKIGDAEAMLDVAAWGTEDLYDRAVYCRAASFLLDSAFGVPMGATDSVSTQENRYRVMFRKEFLPLILRRGHISGGGLP